MGSLRYQEKQVAKWREVLAAVRAQTKVWDELQLPQGRLGKVEEDTEVVK